MSLAIVLELQEVQENDEVTYSTEVISRHKKENRTFIPSHTFWDLQQRNWISAGSKNNWICAYCYLFLVEFLS